MGAMQSLATGPIAGEIRRRLREALEPDRLEVRDDSERHLGHAGHDGRGESHFSVDVVSKLFVGQSRVARQRMVNDALGELLVDRVHALAIRARAPGEG